MARYRKRGIQLGELIEYSVPHMTSYRPYARGEYPIAERYSRTTINFPLTSQITIQADTNETSGLLAWGPVLALSAPLDCDDVLGELVVQLAFEGRARPGVLVSGTFDAANASQVGAGHFAQGDAGAFGDRHASSVPLEPADACATGCSTSKNECSNLALIELETTCRTGGST